MDQASMLKQMFDLHGHVAMVAGATRGLGLECARTVAAAGAEVALCSRNGDEARDTAARISDETGVETLGCAADVSSQEQVTDFVAQAASQLGNPDILVVSAGINIRKDSLELSADEWDQVLNVNLKGSYLLAREVLPAMQDAQWGRIVFFGSILSLISLPGRAAYASSKSGILGLTRTLALENAARGICVNALCPGPFKTPMNAPVYKDPEKNGAFMESIPIQRWGEPEELRGIVLYLCSPACSFMTGSPVYIDGGWTAR